MISFNYPKFALIEVHFFTLKYAVMSKIEYLGRNFVILLSLHNSYTCKSLKVDSSSRHLLLLIYLFICLSVAVLGLCCCMPDFFSGGEQGLLSSCGAQVSHCSCLTPSSFYLDIIDAARGFS